MDLGIKMTNPASLTRDESLALVQRADRLGYHSIWVGERWGLDPFVTLTQLATMTQRIELATGVVNVFSRTPGVIAQAIEGNRWALQMVCQYTIGDWRLHLAEPEQESRLHRYVAEIAHAMRTAYDDDDPDSDPDENPAHDIDYDNPYDPPP